MIVTRLYNHERDYMKHIMIAEKISSEKEKTTRFYICIVLFFFLYLQLIQ